METIADTLPPSQLPRFPRRVQSLFGLPVEWVCEVEWLREEIAGLLHPFHVIGPAGSAQDRLSPDRLRVTGSVRVYDQVDVLKYVSASARRVPDSTPGMSAEMELYQDEERFWLVNDRWGMVGINLLKKSWRSWVLPRPTIDLQHCAEWAGMWPVAQLLSRPDLAILPAISIVRDGWGAVIFSPFKMELELEALTRGGFEVIGPRWSVLREEAGEVRMQRFQTDGENFDSSRCDAVVMIEPRRQAVSRLDELPGNSSLEALHRHWPIVPLHRSRRRISVKLASDARCCEARLSRQPGDLLKLLNDLQHR